MYCIWLPLRCCLLWLHWAFTVCYDFVQLPPLSVSYSTKRHGRLWPSQGSTPQRLLPWLRALPWWVVSGRRNPRDGWWWMCVGWGQVWHKSPPRFPHSSIRVKDHIGSSISPLMSGFIIRLTVGHSPMMMGQSLPATALISSRLLLVMDRIGW